MKKFRLEITWVDMNELKSGEAIHKYFTLNDLTQEQVNEAISEFVSNKNVLVVKMEVKQNEIYC